MKSRIITYVLASLCLMGTVGCGEKATTIESSEASETITTDADEESSEDETTEDAAETDTEQIADDFVLPELSDEIPAEAVTKLKRTEYVNDEKSSVSVEYLDKHDNMLLRIENAADPYDAYVTKNEKYEYNDNGDITYNYELSDYRLNELYSEYDKKNRLISTKCFSDGKLSWEARYEYDKYDNFILDESTYYEDDTGEIMAVFTNDYSDCDYDSNGNMLTVREHSSDGTVRSTYNYTYDSDGNMLTEQCINEKYDPEKSDYKSTEKTYEYDPVCGKRTFEEYNFIAESGEVLYKTTYKRKFDSNGRILEVTVHYSKSDTTEFTTYEYEDI